MVNKWVIKLQDVPADTTIEKFLISNTDLNEQIKKFSGYETRHLKVPLLFDIDKLSTDTLTALAQIRMYPFQYKDVEKIFNSYLSASLTYNPDSVDKLSEDPHQNTLGSTRYSQGNADFYKTHSSIRNSYADTFAFSQRTPLSQYKFLGKFIDSFRSTVIRSRVSKIVGSDPESTQQSYLWHKDESIFLNLRVNIPVQSSLDYVIQIMAEDPKDPYIVKTEEFALLPGHAYAYNTQLPHRPFCKKLNNLERINIICGVSPWFDFDHAEQVWRSNDFYGKVHPFDMLKNGFVSDMIKA